ncbi:MAG: FAD-dependent 5-carboxymethylaminomethyl-2-thiouridine(34) oxidoreductase MnmC [Burkholderiales bacterium]
MSSANASPLGALALPDAWRGLPLWRILALHCDRAADFLRVWQAWRGDPDRPRALHYVALLRPDHQWLGSSHSEPVQGVPAEPATMLAVELGARCWGLTRGFHRIEFDGGHVLLTLCVGEADLVLREQRFAADSIWLGDLSGLQYAFDPSQDNIKALTRCCRRGTRIAGFGLAPQAVAALCKSGWSTVPKPASCEGRAFMATFDPAWTPRTRRADPADAIAATTTVLVIGAGLTGAAVAASFARRGREVLVLDQANNPAAGASSLPAGLFVPHVSADDAPLSRLTRAGIRLTVQFARDRLLHDADWRMSGVLEVRTDAERLMAERSDAERDWSDVATRDCKIAAGVPVAQAALWHRRAGWIKPRALVHALLADRRISFRGGAQVARLVRTPGGWQALDAIGQPLAQAPLVVIAAGHESGLLAASEIPLQPVRGQLSWGTSTGPWDQPPLPPFPVNGNGSFTAGIPQAGGPIWIAGATFDRDQTTVEARAADHTRNLNRIGKLLPDAARCVAPAFESGEVRAWAGVRCTSPDRMPTVGPVDPEQSPGLHIATAMGSRGLSFALLCGELLAARLHGEPLPVPARLAKALDPVRFMRMRTAATQEAAARDRSQQQMNTT